MHAVYHRDRHGNEPVNDFIEWVAGVGEALKLGNWFVPFQDL